MDDSDDAKRAAEKVIELEKKYDSEVIAFHAIKHHMIPRRYPLSVPFMNSTTYTIPPVDYQKIEEAYIERGKKILDKVEELFKSNEMPVELRLIEHVSPADYIKETVKKEEDIDLVALGCKGEHSKLGTLILGNVATKVLNEAPCDVLIVR